MLVSFHDSSPRPIFFQRLILKNLNRVMNRQKPVPLEFRHKSQNSEYNFMWNQTCLSCQFEISLYLIKKKAKTLPKWFIENFCEKNRIFNKSTKMLEESDTIFDFVHIFFGWMKISQKRLKPYCGAQNKATPELCWQGCI